jgi:hypothetical protein
MLAAVAFAALALSACGAPDVELPPGQQVTSDAGGGGTLSKPTITNAPAKYPYAKLALRGTAPNASRVIVDGAGNPATGNVQPTDGAFCVVVDLAAAPAHYVLEVKGQAGDGRVSESAKVELDRDNAASPPADSKLCDGSPAGG